MLAAQRVQQPVQRVERRAVGREDALHEGQRRLVRAAPRGAVGEAQRDGQARPLRRRVLRVGRALGHVLPGLVVAVVLVARRQRVAQDHVRDEAVAPVQRRVLRAAPREGHERLRVRRPDRVPQRVPQPQPVEARRDVVLLVVVDPVEVAPLLAADGAAHELAEARVAGDVAQRAPAPGEGHGGEELGRPLGRGPRALVLVREERARLARDLPQRRREPRLERPGVVEPAPLDGLAARRPHVRVVVRRQPDDGPDQLVVGLRGAAALLEDGRVVARAPQAPGEVVRRGPLGRVVRAAPRVQPPHALVVADDEAQLVVGHDVRRAMAPPGPHARQHLGAPAHVRASPQAQQDARRLRRRPQHLGVPGELVVPGDGRHGRRQQLGQNDAVPGAQRGRHGVDAPRPHAQRRRGVPEHLARLRAVRQRRRRAARAARELPQSVEPRAPVAALLNQLLERLLRAPPDEAGDGRGRPLQVVARRRPAPRDGRVRHVAEAARGPVADARRGAPRLDEAPQRVAEQLPAAAPDDLVAVREAHVQHRLDVGQPPRDLRRRQPPARAADAAHGQRRAHAVPVLERLEAALEQRLHESCGRRRSTKWVAVDGRRAEPRGVLRRDALGVQRVGADAFLGCRA